MITSNKINAALVAATLCVASAGWTAVQAQEVSTDPQPKQQTTETTAEPAEPQTKSTCSEWIGRKVENQQGERLGKIASVAVGSDNANGSYCVLKVKTGMFARTRLVQVPAAAFQPSTDGSYLILNANKANLANARRFDANQWPSSINATWGAEPAAPVELTPAEVYASSRTQSNSRSWGVSSWDQYPCPRTASEAIDEMHSEMINGLPLNAH